ncbi:MAG: DEAD/DEAH box helicase [Candidatus Omnitrophota bacterium]
MESKRVSQTSFDGLGIAPKILEVLDHLKFTVPTPIQHKAIPAAIEGKDIIGVAQTGTGKTLAFAIPAIQRLIQGKGCCLVLVPTRELAIQVDKTFQKFSFPFNIKTAVIIGGASMYAQIQAIRRNPRVLIATPGRLIDHIGQRTVSLHDVSVLVLDEADRMLDMGFLPQIEEILRLVPKNRQTMLFSATIPSDVIKIATGQMRLPIYVEIAPSGTMADNITQELFIVKRDAKRQLLEKLLGQYHGSVLLFVQTKIGARKITQFLREKNHHAAEIHSDRSLFQRREALEGFKSGKYRILVATDIAARGIDVIGIEIVMNYDIPQDANNYVHRIGRTGRAGHEGRAISFATPDQGMDVRDIEKLVKTTLPVRQHPDFPSESFSSHSAHSGDRRSGSGRYGRKAWRYSNSSRRSGSSFRGSR